MKTNNTQKQAGAAMVEFVVVSVVLIPIMFGIPMIGKMIDLKQTAVQASRYSAWETTVNADAPVQNLDDRFFSDSSAPIGAADIGANTLWGPADDATQTAPLGGYHADTAVVVSSGATINENSAYDAGVSNGVEYAPGSNKNLSPAYRVGQAVNLMGSISVTGGTLGDMETDGLIRREATVQMQGNGWLSAKTITQGTVIMNDNWSVADATAARDRVRSLVPASALKLAGTFLGAFGTIPVLKELKVFDHDDEDPGRGVFGHVDMEPLPPSEDLAPRPLKAYDEGAQ